MPRLIDFYRDTTKEKGIDFVSFAFALEDYARYLEKEIQTLRGDNKE